MDFEKLAKDILTPPDLSKAMTHTPEITKIVKEALANTRFKAEYDNCIAGDYNLKVIDPENDKEYTISIKYKGR